MNSGYEQKNYPASMEAMITMRKDMDKARNIQKAVTLTEENWLGLASAVEQTGRAVLDTKEAVTQLPTAQQTEQLMQEQVRQLMQSHAEMVQQLRQEVQTLRAQSEAHSREMQRQQTEATKEFAKQVGSASERFSSELSEAQEQLTDCTKKVRWQMYLPTAILVLWELVRLLLT